MNLYVEESIVKSFIKKILYLSCLCDPHIARDIFSKNGKIESLKAKRLKFRFEQ